MDSQLPQQPWTDQVKNYFHNLGWFEGRRVDIAPLLAERVQQGWTPFRAATDFLEQVEGLGEYANQLFSATCGPKDHQEILDLEQQVSSRLFPVGAEDGWMAFLIDEQGKFYACDLPYCATVFNSLDDFLKGYSQRELTLREPSPDLPEFFDHVFKMVVYKSNGGDQKAPEYQKMIQHHLALNLRIFQWDHPFSEFKTMRSSLIASSAIPLNSLI